jgi:hypothetical protein
MPHSIATAEIQSSAMRFYLARFRKSFFKGFPIGFVQAANG